MTNAIDENRDEPLTEEEDEEGEEEQPETKPESDTLVDSWETENALVFELHGLPDADEVLVIEEDDQGEQKDVAIALSVEDLDEAVEILKEIREMMVERAIKRKTPKVRAKSKA